MKKYNICVVGATGLVGRTFLDILEQRNFPIKNLKLLASSRSAGSVLSFAGQEYVVEELTADSFNGYDIALLVLAEILLNILPQLHEKKGWLSLITHQFGVKILKLA